MPGHHGEGQNGKPVKTDERIADALEALCVWMSRIKPLLERIAGGEGTPGGGNHAAILDRIEQKIDVIGTQETASTARENKIMAFTEDVLSKIAEQTTRLDSIDTALEALVASGTISQANKDAIMAAFGTTDAQIARAEAALAANVPPAPPTP